MNSLINRAIFGLSILGLIISAYLAYEYSLSTPIGCPIGGGCETVRQSAFSSMFGIPIPYFGIAFYLSLAIFSITRVLDLFDGKIKFLIRLIAVVGFLFGAYLTFLEAFVIHAYCFWCVSSFIISTLILVLTILESLKFYEKRS